MRGGVRGRFVGRVLNLPGVLVCGSEVAASGMRVLVQGAILGDGTRSRARAPLSRYQGRRCAKALCEGEVRRRGAMVRCEGEVCDGEVRW